MPVVGSCWYCVQQRQPGQKTSRGLLGRDPYRLRWVMGPLQQPCAPGAHAGEARRVATPVHSSSPLLAVSGGRTQEGYLDRRGSACSDAHAPTAKKSNPLSIGRILPRACVNTNASARLSGCGWAPPSPGVASVPTIETWLILPVVIRLSQRLSHACLSTSPCTVKLRMAQ